ncbi:histone-lysine N-methyltransferase PRDM9 [Silurus asotus]|uniref:Histone-lysine N-methyltransferase PRDM9 n=1 Tax=Silurus asotus TaxID=30991 RepID=A0AAD5AQF4_SILAS|nr:histone-lysine N-methyltransferase PRDM9 [Silurus asotus]
MPRTIQLCCHKRKPLSSAEASQRSSRMPLAPDSAPSLLCGDAKAETSDGGIEGNVKKEEMLELSIDNYVINVSNTPNVISVKVEEADHQDFLYCEVCKSFFFSKCEVHGPAVFITDTHVPMGVADRARQTLPPGLDIKKSAIADKGLGVFNKGDTIPVGAHFGPYQGELVDREEAMKSRYSWVIYISRQHEEYIDAKGETHANWMRFVNCAQGDGEQNLVAIQYRGEILYRCCRPVNPGQELLVWNEEEYAKALGPTLDDFWNIKYSANERPDDRVQNFSCSSCLLCYTSQISLERHMRKCHYVQHVRPQKSGKVKYEILKPTKGSNCQQLSNTSLRKEIQMKNHHCSDCGKGFAGPNALEKHRCIHTGPKQREKRPQKVAHCCSVCGRSFTQLGYLQIHQRLHTGERPYQCSECGKSFTRKGVLLEHQRIHTREKSHRCSQCEKSFYRKNELHRHQRVHAVKKLSHCSQRFGRFPRICAELKPHRCSMCTKSFTEKRDLELHQLFHVRQKLYNCSLCGKSFTQLGNLQMHQRIHTGERPYQCSQCGKRFTRKGVLIEHQRTHTGAKPFHCSLCEKSFKRKGELQRHQHVHARESKDFNLPEKQSTSGP